MARSGPLVAPMDSRFVVHDVIAATQPAGRPLRCACESPARRGAVGALLAVAALPALAQIPECKRSSFTKMVSAQQVEQAAGQQYRQMLQQASNKRALGPKDHPQVVRLRAIAQRIIPFTAECNEAARNWQWEVNLLGSQELNAFCMPGGKIAFYWGILAKLQLDDDEVAAIMGHEISHALLEHAREQAGKNTATQLGIGIGAALLGLGSTGRAIGDLGGQLLSLTYSRDDESQADRLGMIMAAKAGYNPRAGVTLWKKMMAASKGAPPQFLSTHPSSETRIRDIEALLPRVEPIYAAAEKPPQRYGPPAPKAASGAGG